MRIVLAGLLFFLSGATGLVYEIVWSRHLHNLFGVTSLAITTVVAAYMGGLALGSMICGRAADRLAPHRAVAVYGMLEIGIGLFAFGFTALLGAIAPLYREIVTALGGGWTVRAACDFTVAFCLLLVPTTLMGATLPLLVRYFSARTAHAGRGFGLAYALNTAGAVAGALAADFVLIESWGLSTTLAVFGALNLTIGAAALSMGSGGRPLPAQTRLAATSDLDGEAPRPGGRGPVLLAALSGFVALACEIVWVRGFSSLLLSTTHTFALVLAVYLVGVAAGSALGSRLEARRFTLAVLFVALAASTTTQLLLYAPAHGILAHRVAAGIDHDSLLWLEAALVAAIVLPLTLCSGAILPVLVGVFYPDPNRAGRATARVYLSNTLGAVAGAVMAGLVLLPLLGPRQASRLLALLALGALPACAGRRPGILAAGAAATAGALLLPGPTDRHLAHSPVLLGKLGFSIEDLPFETIAYSRGRHADGAISVDADTGQRALWINGMPNASTGQDQPPQHLLAVLPWLYAPRLENALHVGLGSGITTGAWAALPGTRRTRVVELEATLWDLTRAFEPYAYGVHAPGRVRMVFDDANAYLELAPEHSFDVISSQPSQLWVKGTGNLFTTEFFARARRTLRPGGLFVTWIMGYEVPGEVWAIAIATLLDAFPYVHAFATPDLSGDVIFIAAEQPLQLHRERLAALLAGRDRLASIARILDLRQPGDLSLYALADDATLRSEVRRTLEHAGLAGARNTVDRPHLEFLYPRWQIDRTRNELLERLQAARYHPGAKHLADTFTRAPGIREAPRPEVVLRLVEAFRTVPARLLMGHADVDRALEHAAGLSATQREWVYVIAVGQQRWAAARQAWGWVRDRLESAPHVLRMALVHARLAGDPELAREIFAAAPPPGPDTAWDVARQLLDHRSGRGRDPDTLRDYVDRFLACVPPERLLVDRIEARYLRELARRARPAGRLAQVTAWAKEADDLLGGLHPYVAFLRIELLFEQGERKKAIERLAAYSAWRLRDPWLHDLRARAGPGAPAPAGQ